MKTQRRRGFTVVELVVVIAIIAVLAAVLIPTFTSIIKKANDSAYLQERQSQQIADLAEKVEKLNYFTWEDFEKKLAEELAKVDTSNTSAIESAVDKAIAKYAENQQSGNTGLTAEQVQKIVNESMKGQLTTAQVEAIVNQAVSKIGGVNVADVQAIVKSAIAGMGQTGLNASQVKAQIAAALASSDLANKESVEAAIAQALAKFDTLSEQEVAAIVSQAIKDTIPSEGTIYIDGDKTLEAGKTYILRTQKSIDTVTLTVPDGVVVERIIVDAPNVKTVNIVYADGATVKEYVKIVEIVSTAMTSTHINVNAETVEVNKGRAVVGDSATVTVATVTAAPSTNANVVIELETGATVTNPVIAEYQDNGTGTNDTITIIDNTTSADGVGVELTASNELAASGTTTTNVQIEGTNISTANVENNVATTTNNVEIVEVKINDTTYVKTDDPASEYSLFAGGTGTADDPFLIFDYATFQNITKLSWTYYAYESYYGSEHYHDWDYACTYADTFDTMSDAYFKVKDGISFIDCKNWVPVYLDGNFDGNGVVLNNLDMGLFDCVDGESSVIKNFTINANISRSGGVGAVVYNSNTLNLTIDSVDVHGTIIGASWVTPYVEFGPGPSCAWNLTIKNSISDATLVATSGVASGFVGHPYDDVSNGSINGNSLITIIDSAYIGNMSATGATTGNNFKYFTINGNDNRIKTYYSESFIEELGYNPEGTLYKVPADATGYAVINNEDGSKTFFCGNYGKNVVDNYKPAEKKSTLNTTAQATLPANIGDVFTITKVSGATKAVISLQIAPNDSNNYGSYLGTYMSEEINIVNVSAGSTFTSENVRYFTININTDVTEETGVNGNIFNVVNSYYGVNAHNGATVKVVQLDNAGNVLNITSITIAAPHAAE